MCFIAFKYPYDLACENKIFDIIEETIGSKTKYYAIINENDNYVAYESKISEEGIITIQIKDKKNFDKTEVNTKKMIFEGVNYDSMIYTYQDLK